MFLRCVALIIFAYLSMASASSLRQTRPIEVNEQNWENLLGGSDEWMVEFFAPWCPACNRFESTWNQFALKAADLNIKVGAADVNANPVLSGLFSVTSLPTIYHIKDGQYRIYNGNRELNNLVDFIKEKKWQEIEPSSSWLSPNSFLIKLLSLLFKMTIYFKDIYTTLTEHYGYPMWAVLSLFVVVTITFGLLIGILFVLIIDCLCSSKKVDPYDEHLKDDDDIVDEKKESESSADDGQKQNEKASTNHRDKNQKKKAKKDN